MRRQILKSSVPEVVQPPPPPTTGWKTGRVSFGACGHLSQGSPYTAPLTTQFADLHNIFGAAADDSWTIPYRCMETDSGSTSQPQADSMRANGIMGVCIITKRPTFSNYATQTAAFNAAYDQVSTYVKAATRALIFEIGNEWTLQSPYNGTVSGNRLDPNSWRASTWYSRWLGWTAGCIAAIRDNRPDAVCCGGATSGWTTLGLPVALGVDLHNYNGTDLSWDFSILHWYNDFGGGNSMGLPDNFSGGNSAYKIYKPIGKPIYVSEFGSADRSGNPTGAGNNITGLMANFVSHSNVTSTEPGVVAGTVYQLYPNGGEPYQLYSAPGTIHGEGTVVKNWIAANGNPTVA